MSQMMFLYGQIFSALCLQIHGGSFDWCMSNIILPRLMQRDQSYTVKSGEQFVSDDTLVEGWYTVPSGFQVSTSANNIYIGSCGTYFPMWLNGSHPSIIGEEVEVTACRITYFQLCESPFPVKIKSCGSHYVYYLNSTHVNSAYCIEIPKKCSSNSMLPDTIKRDKSHVIGANETFVSDDALHEGWYSVTNGFQLSSSATDLKIGSCGTYYPIWINGTHPSKAGDEMTTIACVRTFFTLCGPSFAVRIKNCGYYYAYYLQNTTLNAAYCIERHEIYTTGTSTVSSKTTLRNTSELNLRGTTSSRPNSTAQTKTENYSDRLLILKTVAIVISTVVILPMAVIALLILWKNKTRRNRFINVLPLEKKIIPVCFIESSDKLDKKIIMMSDPVIYADMDTGNHIPTKT